MNNLDPFEKHIKDFKNKKSFLERWDDLTTEEERINFCLEYLKTKNNNIKSFYKETRRFKGKLYTTDLLQLTASYEYLQDMDLSYLQDVIKYNFRKKVEENLFQNIILEKDISNRKNNYFLPIWKYIGDVNE